MSEREARLLPRPVMRESFRLELRSRLLSEAAVLLAPRQRRPFFAALWLRPAFATAAVIVLAFAGASNAAASSLPGDPLYGLKRAGENVQLVLTFDELARVQLLSTLAERRLDELAEVAKHRPAGAPAVTADVGEALERLDQASKLDAAEKRDAARALAEAAREKHLLVLESLKEKVPANARPELEQVIERETERRNARENERRGQSPGVEQRKGRTDGGDADTDEDKNDADVRPAAPATPKAETSRPAVRTPSPRPAERSGQPDRDGERH